MTETTRRHFLIGATVTVAAAALPAVPLPTEAPITFGFDMASSPDKLFVVLYSQAGKMLGFTEAKSSMVADDGSILLSLTKNEFIIDENTTVWFRVERGQHVLWEEKANLTLANGDSLCIENMRLTLE